MNNVVLKRCVSDFCGQLVETSAEFCGCGSGLEEVEPTNCFEFESEKNMSLILLDEINGNLEDDYEVASVDMVQEYWYPQEVGESKRMVYWEIALRKCADQSGNEIELECAVFVIPDSENGNHQMIANGSKRLVAVFENSDVKQGSPVLVTYKGRQANKTNSNQSDHWSVQLLQKKGSQ